MNYTDRCSLCRKFRIQDEFPFLGYLAFHYEEDLTERNRPYLDAMRKRGV